MTLAEVIFDDICPGCNEIISDHDALESHVEDGHWGDVFEEERKWVIAKQ